MLNHAPQTVPIRIDLMPAGETAVGQPEVDIISGAARHAHRSIASSDHAAYLNQKIRLVQQFKIVVFEDRNGLVNVFGLFAQANQTAAHPQR